MVLIWNPDCSSEKAQSGLVLTGVTALREDGAPSPSNTVEDETWF